MLRSWTIVCLLGICLIATRSEARGGSDRGGLGGGERGDRPREDGGSEPGIEQVVDTVAERLRDSRPHSALLSCQKLDGSFCPCKRTEAGYMCVELGLNPVTCDDGCGGGVCMSQQEDSDPGLCLATCDERKLAARCDSPSGVRCEKFGETCSVSDTVMLNGSPATIQLCSAYPSIPGFSEGSCFTLKEEEAAVVL